MLLHRSPTAVGDALAGRCGLHAPRGVFRAPAGRCGLHAPRGVLRAPAERGHHYAGGTSTPYYTLSTPCSAAGRIRFLADLVKLSYRQLQT